VAEMLDRTAGIRQGGAGAPITFWASAVAPKRCPRPRAVLRRICHVMRS